MAVSAVLWVALGGAAGSATRYWLNTIITRDFGGAFPWGIFAINVSGCFVMGLVAALLLKVGGMAESVRLLVAVGYLGGFTTFSAFALDALRLVQSGNLGLASLYVIGSVVLSLVAVFAGLALMRVVLA
jgi:fluoride exporter